MRVKSTSPPPVQETSFPSTTTSITSRTLGPKNSNDTLKRNTRQTSRREEAQIRERLEAREKKEAGAERHGTQEQKQGLPEEGLIQSKMDPTRIPSKTIASTRKSTPAEKTTDFSMRSQPISTQRTRRHPPWTTSPLILVATTIAALLSFTIIRAFLTRQKDPDGCQMSYMRAGYVAYPDFDTEHTRFASKYSLYLYREAGIDDDTRVRLSLTSRCAPI
jgi:glycosylphosphatidylinositol deacylase